MWGKRYIHTLYNLILQLEKGKNKKYILKKKLKKVFIFFLVTSLTCIGKKKGKK